jgi:hypothetical protein
VTEHNRKDDSFFYDATVVKTNLKQPMKNETNILDGDTTMITYNLSTYNIEPTHKKRFSTLMQDYELYKGKRILSKKLKSLFA